MRRSAPTWLLAVLAVALAAGCGGKKRPPAVATGQGDARPVAEASERPGDEGQVVSSGPDVQPVAEGSAVGSDFPVSPADGGEGGPLEDVRFGYDQATLTEEARALLEKHALWLQARRAARVLVEGHCDERGTAEYNLALGEQRAQAARAYLESLGVAGERLRTVSYGKERPLDPGRNEAAWARNRRAHFVVSRE